MNFFYNYFLLRNIRENLTQNIVRIVNTNYKYYSFIEANFIQ